MLGAPRRDRDVIMDWTSIDTSVTTLNLIGKNITTLEGFPVLPNLQSLYLDGNQLTTLEGFPVLPNLQSLRLTFNQLTTLEGLPVLPNLQSLRLDYNQLTTLDGFPVLPNLQSLRLDYNHLTTLEGFPFFPNLKKLLLFPFLEYSFDVPDGAEIYITRVRSIQVCLDYPRRRAIFKRFRIFLVARRLAYKWFQRTVLDNPFTARGRALEQQRFADATA